jgi:hypothetical protein
MSSEEQINKEIQTETIRPLKPLPVSVWNMSVQLNRLITIKVGKT